MLSKKVKHQELPKDKQSLSMTYGSRYFAEPVPKFEIPENSMSPQAAYQVVSDELNLDGNPALNMATFVTTWPVQPIKKLYSFLSFYLRALRALRGSSCSSWPHFPFKPGKARSQI